MPVIPKEFLAFRCVVMIPTVLLEALIDPRKNALLKGGNKNDKIDARKLPELLRAGLLRRSTTTMLGYGLCANSPAPI